jgi:hypothetical protein
MYDHLSVCRSSMPWRLEMQKPPHYTPGIKATQPAELEIVLILIITKRMSTVSPCRRHLHAPRLPINRPKQPAVDALVESRKGAHEKCGLGVATTGWNKRLWVSESGVDGKKGPRRGRRWICGCVFFITLAQDESWATTVIFQSRFQR